MVRPLESDAATLAGARPRRRFAAGDELRDTAAGSLHLFLAGRATLLAETPFGPHPVAHLAAPALLDLRVPFGGSPGVARVAPETGSVAAWFPADEARALLFDPGPSGSAFRRLALASLTAALRETNAALGRFFDGISAPPPPHARAAKTGTIEEGPIDPARASDLFETAGLDPALLPALGLIARTVLPGAALLVAGEQGEEAFLIAEGRLRVSLEIAGGEEALAILERGEIVGEMALVDDAPRSADVYAHGGPAVVYVLTRAVFRALLASGAPEGAALLAGIALVLTRRLEEAIKKAAGFRILSGPS